VAPKRLTRKEIIEPGPIETALTRIWNWCARNRIILAIAIGGFLLALTGTLIWQQRQRSISEELQSRFAEALDLYYTFPEDSPADENGSVEEPSNPDGPDSEQAGMTEALNQFSTLAQEHPGTKLGLLSQYYTALIKDRLGRSDEAESDLSHLAEDSSDPEIRSLALVVLARLARERSNDQQTQELLEEILSGQAQYFPKDSVLLLLGQHQESAGDKQEALRYYQQLTTEYPESTYLADAQAAINRLQE